MNWQWWNNFAPVFRDIGAGIGAILGGAGAITVISDWSERKNVKNYRNKWKRLLSPARLKNKEIELIKSGDEVYAVDNSIDPKPIRWIRNPSTLHDLGFTAKDAREIEEKELDKYNKHDQINFYAD